jgi:NADPH:quinone reductase-like Zn-dependent oxidoreductase
VPDRIYLGLGQAMVQIAQITGANIFATAGSVAKRELLTKQYGIPVDRIFSTRDLSFVKGIMRITKGKGVDVIVNSLAGEALRKSWECIAEFGRFLELGIWDIAANSGLDMAPFSKSITFSSVNIHVSDIA